METSVALRLGESCFIMKIHVRPAGLSEDPFWDVLWWLYLVISLHTSELLVLLLQVGPFWSASTDKPIPTSSSTDKPIPTSFRYLRSAR